ncbi:MAG: hypothetical protein FWC77_05375 [Defluviitaleaceae bacterium]|nr:hypothetical protein [Defluviitaleaceae bacterium]
MKNYNSIHELTKTPTPIGIQTHAEIIIGTGRHLPKKATHSQTRNQVCTKHSLNPFKKIFTKYLAMHRTA